MAIFGDKKKKVVEKKEEASPVKDASLVKSFIASNVLVRPRVTEKATDLSTNSNAYVFNVDKNATKKSIAQSIESAYKVKPIKVAVINIPHKQVIVRGKRGVTGGGKKAYVYLKKGEKIEII